MPELYLPQSEPAYRRDVLFAVELIDPVTLTRVSKNMSVTAPPLASRPVINFSGRFVWLVERDARPAKIIVEPVDLPYDREEQVAPALPANLDQLPDAARLARVILHPRRDYVFPDGVTVVRGQLNETTAVPPVRVTDAQVWLQWFDADTDDWSESNASMFVRTGANGEFATFLRLAPSAKPLIDDAGRMAVRVRVKRPNAAVRTSLPLIVPQGSSFKDFQTLAWSELQ